MLTDVTSGDLVGDALVAERVYQTIKNSGRVVLRNRLDDAGLPEIRTDILQKSKRSG
jgi:hypothetical protein